MKTVVKPITGALVLAAAVLAAGCAKGTNVAVTAGNTPMPDPAVSASAGPATTPGVSPTRSASTASPFAAGGTAATTGSSPFVAGGATATTGYASTGPGKLVTPTPEPSSKPTPTPTPTAKGGEVVVTNDNNGQTITLTVGERLHVKLKPDAGNYDPPTSSNSAVLGRESSTGGYPGDQPVDAQFLARSAGSSDVTTQTDMACLHSNPRCLPPQRNWTVHVVIH